MEDILERLFLRLGLLATLALFLLAFANIIICIITIVD